MKKGELRAAFHRSKMRLTRQRLAIYRELTGRYDHPDVDTLFRAVKPRIPQISLFTVYRTMNALEGAGMVRRVATIKGHARYDGNAETHAHFLCETCGKIDDVDTQGACHGLAGAGAELRAGPWRAAGGCDDQRRVQRLCEGARIGFDTSLGGIGIPGRFQNKA